MTLPVNKSHSFFNLIVENSQNEEYCLLYVFDVDCIGWSVTPSLAFESDSSQFSMKSLHQSTDESLFFSASSHLENTCSRRQMFVYKIT